MSWVNAFRFRCSECRTEYAEDPALLVCPTCAKAQEPGRATRGVLEVELASLPDAWPQQDPADPLFLAAFLPVDGPESCPMFAVGGTPLLPVPRLGDHLGIERLWIKDDTRNPCGSTKDRASLLVVGQGPGVRTRTPSRQLRPATPAPPWRQSAPPPASRRSSSCRLRRPRRSSCRCSAYGARVVPVDGSYDVAFELVPRAPAREFGWYNRNTALNPFTIEGKKTAALEIARSLAPEVPDVVVVPVGDGVILAGLARGSSISCGAG